MELLAYHRLLEKSIEKEKRLPDIMNFGEKKCGTGWTKMLMKWHPAVVLAKYKLEDNGKTHMERLPEVSKHQVLVDGTAEALTASGGDFQNQFRSIHSIVPNAKYCIVVCEPAKRTFSDFVHTLLVAEHVKVMNITLPVPENFDFLNEFDRFVDIYLPEAKRRYSGSYREIIAEDSNLKSRDMLLLRLGIYHVRIRKFLEYFSREKLHVVNGEKMITNPGKEIAKLQDFFGLQRFIIEDDFLLNPKTGFYCLRPTVYYKGKLYKIPTQCLSQKGRKGRTRSDSNSSRKPSEAAIKKLQNFYKAHNEKLFNLIGRRLW